MPVPVPLPMGRDIGTRPNAAWRAWEKRACDGYRVGMGTPHPRPELIGIHLGDTVLRLEEHNRCPIPRAAAEKRPLCPGGPLHAWHRAEIEGTIRTEHGISGNARGAEYVDHQDTRSSPAQSVRCRT